MTDSDTERNDVDSGEGTFGMSQAFYDRCKVRGTPNVIEETFAVYFPKETDHHLATEDRFDIEKLAIQVGRRRFEEKYDEHARGTTVDEVVLRPSDDEYRGIWLVTVSSDYDTSNELEHDHAWDDKLRE